MSDLSAELTPEQRRTLQVRARAKPPEIAIVGLSGRFPKCDDHHAFWRAIAAGENLVGEVPPERWDHAAHYDPASGVKFVPGKTRARCGGFVPDYDAFDAAFFAMSDEEAPYVDPQERLALEVAWSCIEDAGYAPAAIREGLGLFSGVTYTEFQKLVPISTHAFTLNARLAFFLDARGPTVTTDSGCASSLAALHLACESLAKGECTSALVIGVNLILHPDHLASASRMLSPTADGRSKPFGTDDGWVPAEGVVAMLLKPLAAARAERDHVYGVIKSTHVTQVARTTWFTAADPKKQARLVSESLEKAGVHPETITYVESAANGSVLGDAIELDGLTASFRARTKKQRYCAVGAVKGHTGHAEAASGMMQLAKVLLQLGTKTLYPIANLDAGAQNPNLRLEETPFYLVAREEPWSVPSLRVNGKSFDVPRRASLASFCAAGNMAHALVEEPGVRPEPRGKRERGALGGYFIPLSSGSPAQLAQSAMRLARFLEHEARAFGLAPQMLDVMFTLCTGRTAFAHRAVFVARDEAGLLAQLANFARGEADPDVIVRSDGVPPATDAERARAAACLDARAWHDLGALWVRGADVTWEPFFAHLDAVRLPLPAYTFARKRYPLPKPR